MSFTTAAFICLTLFLSLLSIAIFLYFQLPKIIEGLVQKFTSPELKEIFEKVILPDQKKLIFLIIFIAIDLVILAIAIPGWLKILEFPVSLFIAINIAIIGFKLLNTLFDGYFLEVVLEDRNKINSELFALAQFVAKSVLVLIVIFLFAQTHQINLIGLIASLGVAGAAIALASQKILEQILWSFVLYLDRPFNVGDYIHLSEGIIGQVETTGWRSTKVRLSGKNTLVIVPNSSLAQSNIENLTKARRAVLIVDLIFFRTMSDEEKALIRQLILESTREILGIDSQLTQIMFQDEIDGLEQKRVRTQAIFFVLGSAESSMELRKNLLVIARANIIEKLRNYGIDFKFEEKIVDITQPMRI
ncbi:MAG: mechanosensitive ion channel [Cyanobacteria bacterium SBLK]|nr:mechanosensitive ion channel [Cyanobacteria bacterium SBLK]